MTAADLLDELRSGGLAIELAAGGRIAVRGNVTDAQRELLRARRSEIVRELEAERRRAAVLAMLERDPALERAWLAEVAGPWIVVVGAIRDIGTFELAIDAERYDGYRLAAVLGLVDVPAAGSA